MTSSILFIHGMFQNSKSWSNWTAYFDSQGYNCLAPSWPLHEGEPAALRANPPAELGNLRLQQIIDHYANIIQSNSLRPIVIGHSVGGLIAQKLVAAGLVEAGVPISSVAPNRMLAFDWGFFRNSIQIANPLAGNSPIEMDAAGFHKNFANTLSEADSNLAYQEFATHDSRNALRDCMLETGHIDLTRPHVPMLFIAGDKDEIIPPELIEKNAKAYEDSASRIDYKLFVNRSHFICGEPGWQEVAMFVSTWLNGNRK